MSAIPATLRPLEVSTADLQLYSRNPRRGNVELIVESLTRNGQYRPVVVNRSTMQVLAGNHTLLAARELGWETIAATFVDVDDEAAARIALVDNRASDVAGYDDAVLAGLLESLGDDLEGTGFSQEDLDELLGLRPAPLSLADAYIAPPFTVLDTRQEYWSERRASWEGSGCPAGVDPVLVEIMLRWFCPPAGRLVDPAGDPVVRFVAEKVDVSVDAAPADVLLAQVSTRSDIDVAKAALADLADDRFAAVIADNDRGRGGQVRALSRVVVAAFEKAGLRYYNDVIVVLPDPVADADAMRRSGALGRCHRYVQVFAKGEPQTKEWGA